MTDQLPAFVRTLIPILLGPLLARYGFDVNDPTTFAWVSALLSYGFYAAVHIVELRWPQAGWLLGIAKAPAYSTAPAPSPAAGEDVAAVVVPNDAGVGELRTILLFGAGTLLGLILFYLVVLPLLR